jgi:uncharacterized membrane protein
MVLNLITVAIFGSNLYLRTTLEPGAAFPLVLSVIGVCLLGFSGWLGGHLAYVHAVGVQPQSTTIIADPTEKPTDKLRRTG